MSTGFTVALSREQLYPCFTVGCPFPSRPRGCSARRRHRLLAEDESLESVVHLLRAVGRVPVEAARVHHEDARFALDVGARVPGAGVLVAGGVGDLLEFAAPAVTPIRGEGRYQILIFVILWMGSPGTFPKCHLSTVALVAGAPSLGTYSNVTLLSPVQIRSTP